jgi:hypothetical protein
MSATSDSDGDLCSDSESDNATSESDDDLLLASVVALIAMNHCTKHMNKRNRALPRRSGYQWVIDNLQDDVDCYDMF